MEVDIVYVFDEILGRHMERLLGSRFGIGGMQLQIGTIACLTLLSEHPESSSQAPGQEQNLKMLEEKMTELGGLEDKTKVQALIQEMVEKGYILVDEQGKISAGKPAASMTQLLEHLFPKMPGSTLIAYFIQTIDEVLTGRKTLETAVAHFDQTLKMKGVPLKNQKSGKPSQGQALQKGQKEHSGQIRKELERLLKRTPDAPTTVEGGGHGVRILGSSFDGGYLKVEDIQMSGSGSSSVEEKPVVERSDAPSEAREEAASSASGSPPDQEEYVTRETDALPEEQKPESPISTKGPLSTSEKGADQEPAGKERESSAGEEEPAATMSRGEKAPTEDEQESEFLSEESEHPEEPESLQEAEGAPSDDSKREQSSEEPKETMDDLVEREIASFEGKLASLCPLCKEGRVIEQKTAKGRVYYKCNNEACNLVSWGKPHHMVCPTCNNPFLIEISNENGELQLRCPRATCNYRYSGSDKGIDRKDSGSREPLPAPSKPRRRVIRRRVVRKKR